MKGIVIILILALCLAAVFCQTDNDPSPSEEDLACFASEGVNNAMVIFTNCPIGDVDLDALQGGNVSLYFQ